MWYRLMSYHENEWPYGILKRIVRRGVDRPPCNKIYEDLPDTGDRPNTEAAA